ncbi:copper amine oxidase N-terminal domain-containing protein [Paenibacillus sp. OV219]|uniref:copper amine oxidase N-terminal domain-containing protein n=1 Tax=Paenibacillus sp. OV219 TaxID=1884377 RepID=UPI002109CA27|nr:copper amine oxidase N-terminal domain-containing protein [Paenibacillus sp. OV219]
MRKARYAFIALLLIASIVLQLPVIAFAKTEAESAAIKVTMNGKSFTPKSAPYRDGSNIYLPLRDMGELLGTTVSWTAATKSATLYYPNLSIKLIVGELTATVNGQAMTLSVPLQLVQGRIYVPLRFLSEATGAKVEWDAAATTVHITRSDDLFKEYPWSTMWLNRKTGEIYMTKDEQTPVTLLGKLDGTIQGTISINSGGATSSDYVLTIVDKVGVQYTAYELLVHAKKIVAQQKAVYKGRYEQNASYTQVLVSGAWQARYLLTDGRDVSVYDQNAKPIESYNLPELFGKDDVYTLQSIGVDYVVARPSSTGLLTLLDQKDNSVVVLADKLLTGDELKYARTNKIPYLGDTLNFAADMGHGQMDFFYTNPLESNRQSYRLTYMRPSYEKEREQLPKSKPLKELAASCSPQTVESVYLQEGDLAYFPLVGANPDDHDKINKACSLLKKFVSKGVVKTVRPVVTETFFHGMDIEFTDGVSYIEVAEGAGLTIAQGNDKALVLQDAESYHLYNELKVEPPPLVVTPNPAHFGEKLHLVGVNGDSQKESPLIVYWVPIQNNYNSADPDPSLIIYKSTAKFGRYSVDFKMPAFGTAVDGTLKPIPLGKGYIRTSGMNYGNGSNLRAEIELKPATGVFLSLNGIPVADPASKPLTENGRVYIPVRSVAGLSGQSVNWDARTSSVLVRTNTSAIASYKGGASLWIDGKLAAAELAPILRGGIAYIPIRAVTAAFGLPVVWDSASRSVNLTVKTTTNSIKG